MSKECPWTRKYKPMKRRLLSVLLIFVLSISLLSIVYAESESTITFPANYSIMAHFKKGEKNGTHLMPYDTYVVRVPKGTTSIGGISTNYKITGKQCLSHDFDHVDENAFEFSGDYDLNVHATCIVSAPTNYIPWEGAKLYNFYEILYCNNNDDDSIKVFYYLADGDGQKANTEKLEKLLETRNTIFLMTATTEIRKIPLQIGKAAFGQNLPQNPMAYGKRLTSC